MSNWAELPNGGATRAKDFEARYFEDFQSDLQEDIVEGGKH
jgi:hypothetical protein